MVLNWLLSHLICGLAAALLACVIASYYKPKAQ